MTDDKTFPLADVLTVTTGRLLSHDHVDGLYRILNYLTGDNLMTHQLGRAVESCGPQVLEQQPWLADLQPPDGLDMPNLFSWLASEESRHPTVTLSPVATWEHRNPLEELLERVGPDQVIPVVVTGA